MNIKINEKILCLPPFISTSWDQVRSLKIEIEPLSSKEVLVISLIDGHLVKLIDLGAQLTEAIFNAHLRYLDNVTKPEATDPLLSILQQAQKGGRGMLGLEGFTALLHHNPQQADMPPLPPEVLSKVLQASKAITPQEAEILPKPEGSCNCLHCQIARTLQQSVAMRNEMEGAEVKPEELTFRTWDITNIGEDLYAVKTLEDAEKTYNVSLSTPVSCSCGMPHCEHIRAVLNS